VDSYEERICRIRHTVKEKVLEDRLRVKYMIRGRGRQGFLRAASTARLLAAAMAKNCRCEQSESTT
jgi:hypothetical protein